MGRVTTLRKLSVGVLSLVGVDPVFRAIVFIVV